MTELLAQYAPLPLRLAYVAYLPFLISAAVIVFKAPETVQDTKHRFKDVSLKPRIGVPRDIRAIPSGGYGIRNLCVIRVLFRADAELPSAELHETNRAVAGAVVFELSLIAAEL